MIAAALSMISGVAVSKERSTHCNALDAGPMYNKVELSEKDKCWLNHWKEDETAGTLGSIFWMRLGDGFVSMPVKDLRMAGSKDKAVKVITNKVVDTVVVGVAQDTHDAAVAERDRMIAALTNTNSMQAEEIATQLAGIAALNDHINDIKAALTRFGPVETPEGRLQRITDLVNDLRAANSDLFFAARDIADALVTAGNIDGYSDDELFVYQTRGSNYEAIEDRDDVINANSEDVTNVTVGNLRGSGNLFDGYTYELTLTVGDTVVTLTDAVSEQGVWRKAVEKAFDEGYKAGFNDGYDRGYNRGYKDGFRDGVESISNA